MFLILLFLKNDSLLLFHQLSFLIKDLLDSLINSILHLFGFNLLSCLGHFDVLLIALDLLVLLIDLELVLHMLLPEIIDFLSLFVNSNLALGNLINKLLTFTLHASDHFDLVDVFSLENLNLDFVFGILIPLNH